MVVLASNLISASQPTGAQGIQGIQGITGTGSQGIQGISGAGGGTTTGKAIIMAMVFG